MPEEFKMLELINYLNSTLLTITSNWNEFTEAERLYVTVDAVTTWQARFTKGLGRVATFAECTTQKLPELSTGTVCEAEMKLRFRKHLDHVPIVSVVEILLVDGTDARIQLVILLNHIDDSNNYFLRRYHKIGRITLKILPCSSAIRHRVRAQDAVHRQYSRRSTRS